MNKRTFGYTKTKHMENLEAGLFIGIYVVLTVAFAVQALVK